MQQNANQPPLVRYADLPEGYNPSKPWEHDCSPDREALAVSLTSLFRGSTKPFVLAVNAGWGTGKSLFLRMWHDQLHSEQQPCFIFNAWEHDHAGTPINAFFAAIKKQSKSKDTLLAATATEMWSLFKESVPEICGKIAGAAVTASCSGLAPLAPAIETAATTGLQAALHVEDSREKFRNDLREMATRLVKGKEKPLVIMVDELDRCRPDFAIALLENIKHLFSVEGVVFVLALEKKQLEKCIGATYGFDAEGTRCYLGKFIDMTLELPSLDTGNFFDCLLRSYPLCNPPDWFDLSPNDKMPPPKFSDLAEQILCKFSLSPRSLAQAMCRLSIIISKPNTNSLAAIICTLLVGYIETGGTIEHGINSIAYNKKTRPNSLNDLFDFSQFFTGIFFPYRSAIMYTMQNEINISKIYTHEDESEFKLICHGVYHDYPHHLYKFLTHRIVIARSVDDWAGYIRSTMQLISKFTM